MARIPPDSEVIAHVLSLPQVRDEVRDIAREVEQEALYLAARRAYDDGRFRSGFRMVDGPDGAVSVVTGAGPPGKEDLPEWIEGGTGIYGPTRRRITPKRGKYLVFPRRELGQGPGLGYSPPDGLIFAKSVRGRPASWIMRDAAMAVVARRLGLRFRNWRTWRG